MRENSIKKDNWNLFVGDVRYKTNFFLNFLDPSLKTLFDNHLLTSSLYSIRLFIILICLVDLFLLDKSIVEHSFFSRIFVISLMLCSIYATTKPARMHHLLIKQSMLVSLSLIFSKFFVSSCFLWLSVIVHWLSLRQSSSKLPLIRATRHHLTNPSLCSWFRWSSTSPPSLWVIPHLLIKPLYRPVCNPFLAWVPL